jgi:hypothetical protein
MNLTECDYYSNTCSYVNGIILLGVVFNTVYLFCINKNIKNMRQEIKEQNKLPTYSPA